MHAFLAAMTIFLSGGFGILQLVRRKWKSGGVLVIIAFIAVAVLLSVLGSPL